MNGPAANATNIISNDLQDAVELQDPAVILRVVRVAVGQLTEGGDSAAARLALLEAIRTATTLSSLDTETAFALLQTLQLVTDRPELLDQPSIALILELLNQLGRIAGTSAFSFCNIVSSLVQLTSTGEVHLSLEDTNQLKDSMKNMMFSWLEEKACNEPAATMEANGVAMLASIRSDYAGSQSTVGSVDVSFGQSFTIGTDGSIGEDACNQFHQLVQDNNPYAFQVNASYKYEVACLFAFLLTNEQRVGRRALARRV